MQTRDPKSLRECLDTAGLAGLLKRSKEITALSEALAKFLPEALISHYQVLNIEQDTAVLIVDSAAFSTRLRYLMPDLLKELHKISHLSHIDNIYCRVMPKTFEKSAEVIKKIVEPLSSETQDLLEKTAENIKHPKLKAALSKLGK